MECDVIQDCALDVDPLSTVEHSVDIDGNITSIYQDSMTDAISDSNESIHLPETSNTSPANVDVDVASAASKHIYENSNSGNTDNNCNNSSSLSNLTILKSGEINYHYYPHHSKVSKVRSKVLKRHHQTLRQTPPRIIVKPPTLLSSTSRSPQNKQHPMANAGKSDFREPMVSRANNDATDSTSKLATSVKSSSIKPSTGMSTSLRKLNTSSANALQHGPASTMREVLASIPGFNIKTRRRGNKKMSTAAQIEQTREGRIDLETPDSILVSTNLRDLLNKETFCLLPPLYQYKLVQLLPSVDRPNSEEEIEKTMRLTSNLTNEFFARACLEWRERLAEGEFTPENQLKLRSEAEKEKTKLDPWKLKHFEPIWGEKIRLKHNSRFIPPQSMSTSSSSGAGAPVTPSTSKQLNLVSKSSSSTTHSSIGSSQSRLPSSFASGKHSTVMATAASTASVSAATTVSTSLSGLRAASSVSRKPTLGNRKLMLSDRPSLKTTIKLRPTTSIATSTIPLTPHNYTTSSGRIVKSPNNVYASGASVNAGVHNKRTRTGAVTRSSLATTSTNSSASPELNNQMKVSVALPLFTFTFAALARNQDRK